MDEEIPLAPDTLREQLQAVLARRRQRPLAAERLRRCYFYAALPQSCWPTPPTRRGGLLGRLFRRATRSLLVFRGPRRQPGELGPGGIAA
jgi:hypothetical protein